MVIGVVEEQLKIIITIDLWALTKTTTTIDDHQAGIEAAEERQAREDNRVVAGRIPVEAAGAAQEETAEVTIIKTSLIIISVLFQQITDN
jgi:hypothetical protein